MATGTFECIFPTISGEIEVQILDPEGVEPVNIIQIGDKWTLQLNWNIHGSGIQFFNGTWNIVAYLESIGPGPEWRTVIEEKGVAYPGDRNMALSTSSKHVYQKEVPARDNYPNRPGLYKLVVVLTSVDNGTAGPGPFAGYAEGPMMQFYKDV